ncbi:MAG: lactate dehydrogenase [Lentisphaerae bacterium RIFOXYA12_FULL_48_11]|nr:MAG: lactate dehydrogenase [Lentisphaerae bacterium RIFOXYA12_FULL_48_11]
MGDDIIIVDASYLEKFMRDVFVGVGVPPEDASVCAEVLITSDKRGIESHGINRCKPIYYDRIKAGILNPVTKFEVVRETMTTAVVDGHNGMGHAIAKKCMEMTIRKAKDCGMGMVVARNSTHYGIAGYYVLMAAEAGMIGVCGTNARPSVAPTFGVENMLGTNPLSFGMPTDEEFPFVLDCATSVTQRGKIEVYARQGKDMPPGWVIGSDGQTRTDTRQVLKDFSRDLAALVPVGGPGEDGGGYKGYGYSTVVEILSSALQAGNFMKALCGMSDGKPAPIELGHFFIAMNVEAFCELADFKKRTGDILRALRASRRAPGCERIYTAGEKEYEASLKTAHEGVPLPKGVRDEMVLMRNELGLTQYVFPWE